MFWIGQRLKTLPSLFGWLESVGYGLLFMAIAVVVMPSAIAIDQSPPFGELLKISAIAFFIPALTEEIIFRGLFLPKGSAKWMILSTLAYVLWHPLEALTFLPESALYFLNLRFLLLVALLGIFCLHAYRRTGSLWASVLVHWLVVVAWKAAGGARFIA
ncbi:MAG: CPBP family glutamic-type intramembrane protease [Cyanobacteria bacterium J06627_28]